MSESNFWRSPASLRGTPPHSPAPSAMRAGGYAHSLGPMSPPANPLGARLPLYPQSAISADTAYQHESARTASARARPFGTPPLPASRSGSFSQVQASNEFFDPVSAGLAARQELSARSDTSHASARSRTARPAFAPSASYGMSTTPSLADLVALERSQQPSMTPSASATNIRTGSPALSSNSSPRVGQRTAGIGIGITGAGLPVSPSGAYSPGAAAPSSRPVSAAGFRPASPNPGRYRAGTPFRPASPGVSGFRPASPGFGATSPGQRPTSPIMAMPPSMASVGGFAAPGTPAAPIESSEQHVFVFGSQGPARFAQTLLSLIEHAALSHAPASEANGNAEATLNGNGSVHGPKKSASHHSIAHLSTFFQMAHDTIREQIEAIKDPKELSVIPNISVFKNLKALCQYHMEHSYENALVNGILLVVLQVAQALVATIDWEQRAESQASLEGKSSAHTCAPLFRPETHFVGFCTGAISATVLAAAEGGAWSIIRQGITAVKITFWVSLRSSLAAVAYRREQAQYGPHEHAHVTTTAAKGAPAITGVTASAVSGPETTLAWSYTMTSTTLDLAQKWIGEFNERVNAADNDKLVVTAVTPNSVSIGGPPQRLETFADTFHVMAKGDEAAAASRCLPLKIFSPYHHSAQLELAVESVKADLAARNISILAGRQLTMTRKVYNILDGTPLCTRNLTDSQLVEFLIESNLSHVNRLDLVADNLADELASTVLRDQGTKIELHCASPSVGLANSIQSAVLKLLPGGDDPGSSWQAINNRRPQVPADVTVHDLGAADRATVAGPTSYVTSENDEVAIISMSCRLPGQVDSPEAFWSLLQERQSTVDEIPRHLFDINNYFGDGVNQTQVRHMHALGEETTTTMDLRICNISPKEAEQMDPQHRLAILCAYEALEKAGYAPNATQSYDSRRMAYFACVTSDDYRENVMGSPQGIGSYFVSGCIRAFIPGMPSFSFKFEGPSNSFDSGETSSLVTIEHAVHALQSGQCDVALAGGFSVLTSPHMFIGLDADGVLSHSDRQGMFSSNHEGVVRGDAAVVLCLKRLSDAIAEGDEILATVPGSTHRTLSAKMSAAEQEAGLRRAFSLAGISPSSVTHVEASGYYDTHVEAAEFKSVEAVFGPATDENRIVTVGSPKANVGASEAAMGMVQVMKAVLMLQHDRVPPQLPVEDLNSFIRTIHDQGRVVLPFSERTLSDVSSDTRRKTIVVHGLAQAGTQAIALISSPPEVVRPQTDIDVRRYHMYAVSAKSPDSLDAMCQALSDYVSDSTDMLRLSYTLAARRNQHPFRVAFVASSPSEFKAKVVSAPSAQIKAQGNEPKTPAVFLAGGLSMDSVEQLAQADPAYSVMVSDLSKVGQSLIGRSALSSLPLSDVAVLMGLVGDMALISLLRHWRISPALIATGSGVLAALVAADGLSPSEAMLAGILSPTEGLIKTVLTNSGTRPLAVPIRLAATGATIEADGKTTVADVVDVLISEMLGTGPAAPALGPDIVLLDMGLATPWLALATFLADLHIVGIEAEYAAVYRQYLPQLRYLSDLPTYRFSLTRHWTEYTDRNLIRDYDMYVTEMGSAMGDSGDFEDEETLTPPGFPLLGRLVKFTFSDEGTDSGFGLSDVALYEAEIGSDPMIRFIRGHLVNGVPLAPATLYADLFMEAAIDVFSRTGVWNPEKLTPELQALEMVRPLSVRGQPDDPVVMGIRVTGDFHSDRVFITISSRAPKAGAGSTETTHASAHIRLVDAAVWKTTWARFNTLIHSRYRAVRASEKADIIGAKLAYSAFESVVSYTPTSGFRGMRSVALLETAYEAASKVIMSPDSPSDVFHINPCYIDSLGQITGFIVNSLADQSHVFIADGVGVMRFTKAVTTAAEQGETFEVHCQMAPTDDSKTVFTGDAFFMRASDSTIVGEMVGVRYKKIPTKVLQTLLPPLGAKSKPSKPKAVTPSIAPSMSTPAVTSSGPLTSSTNAAEAVFNTIMGTIQGELGVDSGIQSSASFADLGLDSLMSIVILGSLSDLPVALPPSLFLDCLTPSDLHSWISEAMGDAGQVVVASAEKATGAGSADEAIAMSATTTVVPVASGRGGKTEEVLTKLRAVVLKELGVEDALLTDTADLAAMGLDSLMSLLILGSLAEELDVTLEPDLFITCNSMNDLRAHFSKLFKDTAPPAAPTPAPAPASASASAPPAAASPGVATESFPAVSTSVPSLSIPAATGKAPSAPSRDAAAVRIPQSPAHATASTVVPTPPTMAVPVSAPVAVPPRSLARWQQPVPMHPTPTPRQPITMPKTVVTLHQTTAQKFDPALTPRAGETPEDLAEIEGIRLLPPQLLFKSDSPTAHNVFLVPDGSGIGAAYAQLGGGMGNCNIYGMNSPFVANTSAWTGGVRKIALTYLKSIRTVQPKGPYYLGGWSFGGVVSFEIATILGGSSDPTDEVAVLLLLDSPPPCRYPPLPMSMVEWITSSDDVPTPPTLSDRLLAHFQATVDNLGVYGVPPPITSSALRRPHRVVHIAARRGVSVSDTDVQPDMTHPTVQWLVGPRQGLGCNGWDYHLPDNIIECKEVDTNHFTLVWPPASLHLAKLITLACK